VGTIWLRLAAELTGANQGDNAVAPLLLHQLPGEVRYMLGDTHYATQCYNRAGFFDVLSAVAIRPRDACEWGEQRRHRPT
jgi:hypothetical protein